MIYTVTLNPAIDYVIETNNFSKGDIVKYKNYDYMPGGKGINVSLMLSNLGIKNMALGICGGFSGKEIVSLINKSGCTTDFVFLKNGNSRINIKICGQDGEETDFNGEGPRIEKFEMMELKEKIKKAGKDDFVVLAGSLPKSCGKDTYKELCSEIQDASIIVDATGEALLQTLPFKPFLVKPNDIELGELFGVEIDNIEKAEEYGLRLMKLGSQNVIVSMGEKGAIFLSKNKNSLFLPAAAGKKNSTVGAGDSMIAGFLYGIINSLSLENSFKWAVAAGGATAFSKGIASKQKVMETYSCL